MTHVSSTRDEREHTGSHERVSFSFFDQAFEDPLDLYSTLTPNLLEQYIKKGRKK